MDNLDEKQFYILTIAKWFDNFCRTNNLIYFSFGGTALGARRHEGFIPWDDDYDVVLMPEDYKRLNGLSTNINSEGFIIQPECKFGNYLPFTKIRLIDTVYKEKGVPLNQEFKYLNGIYIDVIGLVYTFDNKFLQKLHFILAKIFLTCCLNKRGYKTNSRIKKGILFLSNIILVFFKPYSLVSFFRNISPKSGKNVAHFFGKASFAKSIYPSSWFQKGNDLKFNNIRVPVIKNLDNYLIMRYGEDYLEIPPINDSRRWAGHCEYFKYKK